MKKFLVNIVLILTLGSCNINNQKEAEPNNDTSNISSSDSLEREYIKAIKTLRNAEFKKSVNIVDSMIFSNPNQKDRFELIINKGKITDSKSIIRIFRSSQIIYTDTFDSYYFVKHIFEPDTIPKDVDFNDYIKFYGSNLEKYDFEEFALNNANQLFDNIFISIDALKSAKEFGIINDTLLFDSILKNPDSRVIKFPLFNSDFGSEYFVYSTSENKIKSILTTD
jgi:hypothetical protein